LYVFLKEVQEFQKDSRTAGIIVAGLPYKGRPVFCFALRIREKRSTPFFRNILVQ
jgi:hypothetical protein